MTGRLLGIARHARPRGPMETADRVSVTLEGGIEGDHRGRRKPGGTGRRQVTVITRADWDAAMADLAGYAGLEDKVDFHEWRLLKGIAMSTLLGIGTELSLGNEDSELVRAIERSVQRDGARAGDQLVSRNLEVQPTLTIRPGWPVRAVLHKDLILKPWRE